LNRFRGTDCVQQSEVALKKGGTGESSRTLFCVFVWNQTR
jgi:hypothetical protein